MAVGTGKESHLDSVSPDYKRRCHEGVFWAHFVGATPILLF